MALHTILIVEDEVALAESMAALLASSSREVLQAHDVASAIEWSTSRHVDVCICDMCLGTECGLALMERLRELDPQSETIIVTGFASVETAVDAMQRGAFAYLAKPFDSRELRLLVERAVRQAQSSQQQLVLEERLRYSAQADDAGMVVRSASMQAVLDEARDLASLPQPVVIHGETGTGKDLIAHYIHRASPRADGPWNVLNCASLTEGLVDAELFGHERGAFTGADQARPGIIAASDGGTLFLDEIGDLPEIAQARLLRFLENGVVRAVGSSRERHYDVRIVAASHRSLADEVTAGRFREDLYHRLVVFPLDVPPLRERREDVPALARHFLQRLDADKNLTLDSACLEQLARQSWPGNVRELRNVIERAWLHARRRGSDRLETRDLRLIDGDELEEPALSGYGRCSLEEAQRRHIREVLALCQSNRREASDVLGISERHLYRLLRQQPVDTDVVHGKN